MEQLKFTAIIPARGGSKGIPKKNIKSFCGKPLIAWAIEQAQNTPEIQEIYVTSDSEEILSLGKSLGSKIIRRPDALATDTASADDAILHAVNQLKVDPYGIVMIEPTCPLRQPGDLSRAIQSFLAGEYDSLFSAGIADDFLFWKKSTQGSMESVNYDYKNRGRRQEREPLFVESGVAYIFKPSVIRADRNRLGGEIGMFTHPLWQKFELDNPEDWELVEGFFRAKIFRSQ